MTAPFSQKRDTRFARHGLRGAHTLIEMVASIAILSIIVTGLGSSMVIASRAADATNAATSPAVRAGDSRRCLDRLLADLSLATAITEKTSTAITMTVPDRTSDGVADQLRYAWNGSVGSPLTLSINGGTAAPLVDNLKGLSLTYSTRTSGPPATTTGAETLLLSHDDAPLGSFQSVGFDSSTFVAAFVRPVLPANAVSWELTKIEVYLKRTGNNATAAVCVRNATVMQLPGSTLYASSPVPTNSTSNFVATTVNFTGASGLDPYQGVCIVFCTSSGVNGGIVQYEQNGVPMTTNTHFLLSNDSGASWSAPDTTRDLRIKVYGKVTS